MRATNAEPLNFVEKPQEKRQNGGATKFCGDPENRLAAPLPKLAAPPPFSGSTCRRWSNSWAFGWADARANKLRKALSDQNAKLYGYLDLCCVFSELGD